ncbi:MAG TPA: 50S ribosomal protein L35 [Phycisphaerae bacterium]|nr:50S ribosomal protein L35 [Phycisphaerae bacterium]
MPKGKTHKGIAKRMRRTRTGKILHNRSNAGHLMSGKTGKRKRRLRGKSTVKTGRVKVYTRLLGG